MWLHQMKKELHSSHPSEPNWFSPIIFGPCANMTQHNLHYILSLSRQCYASAALPVILAQPAFSAMLIASIPTQPVIHSGLTLAYYHCNICVSSMECPCVIGMMSKEPIICFHYGRMSGPRSGRSFNFLFFSPSPLFLLFMSALWLE